MMYSIFGSPMKWGSRAEMWDRSFNARYGQGARRNHVTARENYAWRNAYHGIRGGND